MRLVTSILALLLTAPLLLAQKPSVPSTAAPAQVTAGTLDRIRESARVNFGYRTDARPFSYKDEAGQAAGYSVALCQHIAQRLKNDLRLATLAVNWVPVSLEERFRALEDRRIDILCGADTVTLARRVEVNFSIPIFPGGVGTLIRSNAPYQLREVLAGRGQPYQPTWRASASRVLQARAFSVVSGTTAEKWLAQRFNELQVVAPISPVDSYGTGIQAVLNGSSDVLVGERAVLLDAAQRRGSAPDLVVVDRLFTYEPIALGLRRGDDDMRLQVDRYLSRLYSSGALTDLYTASFGAPDEGTVNFFRWNALPE